VHVERLIVRSPRKPGNELALCSDQIQDHEEEPVETVSPSGQQRLPEVTFDELRERARMLSGSSAQ
jgi:hypothetical protein